MSIHCTAFFYLQNKGPIYIICELKEHFHAINIKSIIIDKGNYNNWREYLQIKFRVDTIVVNYNKIVNQ